MIATRQNLAISLQGIFPQCVLYSPHSTTAVWAVLTRTTAILREERVQAATMAYLAQEVFDLQPEVATERVLKALVHATGIHPTDLHHALQVSNGSLYALSHKSLEKLLETTSLSQRDAEALIAFFSDQEYLAPAPGSAKVNVDLVDNKSSDSEQ